MHVFLAFGVDNHGLNYLAEMSAAILQERGVPARALAWLEGLACCFRD